MGRNALRLLVAVLTLVVVPSAGAELRPLATGLVDPATFSGPQAELAFARTAAAGARTVRLFVSWAAVAPKTRPAGFRADDPADPSYNWAAVDRQITLAAAPGLEPIFDVIKAPKWAQDARDDERGWGNWRVDPAALAAFTRAAATRYSGSFGGLPRVRLWQVWNEPNLSLYLNPQMGFAQPVPGDRFTPFDPDKPLSPDLYRDLVNAFADAVHGVHADNVVAAGGLAPFTAFGPHGIVLSPLRFMRLLLCMSDDPQPKRTCSAQTRFDVWSTHPYTSGGPTHHAREADDVSLGDLPEMNRVLRAAVRAGHVQSGGPVQFWVTEFGWDSTPPDPNGVPERLHARWVAEALYRMWRAGIGLVTWLELRDAPLRGLPGATIQSGLYRRGGTNLKSDRPKLALRAFRFPFVAFRHGSRVEIWGRTPTSAPAAVVIERSTEKGWRRLGVVAADANGMFRRTLTLRSGGRYVRARLDDGQAALPFSLIRPADRAVNPFGGPIER